MYVQYMLTSPREEALGDTIHTDLSIRCETYIQDTLDEWEIQSIKKNKNIRLCVGKKKKKKPPPMGYVDG